MLRSAHAADMPAALREGAIHLGLVWDYDFLPRTVPADIEWLHLVDDPLFVLVPTDHPLAGESEVDLLEFAGENWVVRGHNPPYDEAFTTMCRLAGPDLAIAITKAIIMAGLRAIETSKWAGLVSSS